MTTTVCILPHRRRRESGEPITAPDGTITPAKGGETVWDHVRPVPGVFDGYLCVGHLGALRVHLETLAAITLHCRRLVPPSGAVTDGRGSAVDAPAPLSLDALDAADDIAAWMWSWCSMIAEESGQRLTNMRGWSAGGHVRGLRDRDRTLIVDITGWLLDHLDWAVRQPWIDEWVTEAKEKATQLDRRWPRQETPVFLPMPCPACDLLTLVRHPPRFRDLPVLIVCDSDRCGEVLPENMYDWYAKRFTQERRA